MTITVQAVLIILLGLLSSPLPIAEIATRTASQAHPIIASTFEQIADGWFDDGQGPAHRINSVIGNGIVRERSDSSSLPASPNVRQQSDISTSSGSARVIEVGTDVTSGNRIFVIDGDTIALPCVQPAPGCAEKIRLQGIDTPETFNPSCEAERAAGLRAKERLVELIRGKDVTVSRSGRDRYGRTLGDVRADGADVGAVLVNEGFALPYEPGSRAKASRIAHWCGAGDW